MYINISTRSYLNQLKYEHGQCREPKKGQQKVSSVKKKLLHYAYTVPDIVAGRNPREGLAHRVQAQHDPLFWWQGVVAIFKNFKMK